jgi:hypothetical protein
MCRQQCLDVVLPLCCDSNDGLRRRSIAIVCNQMAGEQDVTYEVVDFADKLLQSFSLPPVTAAAASASAAAGAAAAAVAAAASASAHAASTAAATAAGAAAAAGAGSTEGDAAMQGGEEEYGGEDEDEEGPFAEEEEEEEEGVVVEPLNDGSAPVPSRNAIPQLLGGPSNVAECRYRLELYCGLVAKDYLLLDKVLQAAGTFRPELRLHVATEVCTRTDRHGSSKGKGVPPPHHPRVFGACRCRVSW